MELFEHVIVGVREGSTAQEIGLEPGDVVLSVNGQPIVDIFDYQFYMEDEYVELLVRHEDGEEELWEIEKDIDDDLGIVFASNLMDDYKSCCNQCIFCFVDQMPKGMRDTLYFKDDDSRLSFLQGNYITLTNMKEEEIDRIIRYRLAPINISVHTTNPELRCKMLHNRFAGNVLSYLNKLYDNEIPMNGQIVLCKGWNDGEELDQTIRDLAAMIPVMESVSVVPVGLTKYREGLETLSLFNREDAREVISLIESWQKKLFEEHGIHFIHASDEWYILAELPFPEEERYDGYLQLENGVGMMRLLWNECQEAIEEYKESQSDESTIFEKRVVSIATGKLAYGMIHDIAEQLMEEFPWMFIKVYQIENRFFGETVTVSGLLTGQDIIDQLREKELGETLFLPCNVLKADEEIFLDDITLEELQNALQVKADIVKSDGKDLILKLLDIRQEEDR
jgi:putative radical SAM enzyme (TIGR03279 family)